MHLFSQENIWSNPHSCKYNNSVDRIIPKEEEREDPREILQSSVQLESKSVSSNSTGITRFLRIQCILQCFHTQSSRFPVIPCKENYSTYRINSSTRILQEILQLQDSSHAVHYKASSSNCSPCIQAFYTAE